MGIKGNTHHVYSVRIGLTILGLFGLLKSIQKPSTLKKFSGQTIGIDAYGWLHRGILGCAFALALDKPTTIHVDFVLSRVRMLLDFGVTPYLVFDGDDLPSKAGTNSERHKRREEAKARALQLHKAGKISQAQLEFPKAVDVTPVMARQLIEELKKLNIQYIVAPYEADAQLVYLEQKGIIDGILSEDSDLLVFGAKCLLTKLNQYGELVEVNRADFAICKEISFTGWTQTMFRQMAILSGCDYLPNIGKIGLKTAHAHIRKHKSADKVIKVIQFEGKHTVPEDYCRNFQNAELTFLHHRVFCPVEKRMVFLNELPPGLDEASMPFLGPHVGPDLAARVACGDLHPFSKLPIQLDKVKSGRPVLAGNRRQSYASEASLKLGKSIETFFKPSRQPLAELDPNSLTPSPGQRRLLEQYHNTSWEPRLVSSAPGLRRTIVTTPTTDGQPSQRAGRSEFLARASSLSTYKPPKRQRLCSELASPTATKEVNQSPFFKTNEEEASPLAPKTRQGKKGRKSNFDIFSDDAISDELLVQLEHEHIGRSNTGGPRTKSDIEARHEAEAVDSVPQSSPVSRVSARKSSSRHETLLRKTETGKDTERDKIHLVSQRDDPDAFHDLLEFHVRRQNEVLLQKSTIQAGKTHPPVPGLMFPATRGKLFSDQSPEAQESALRALPTTTSVDDFCKTINLHETFAHQPPDVQRVALENLGKTSGPSKRSAAALDGKKSRPLSDTKTKPFVTGSEDALVPNSEDEISEIGSPVQRCKLDLSVYAFTP